MARIRSIYPEACDSERLAGLTDAAERLWWRFQTHCDDDGRADDNARLIAAKCAPLIEDWDTARVEELLTELARAGLIQRYLHGSKYYIQVLQWGRFQHPRKPKKDQRPAPPALVTPVDNPTEHTDATNEDAPVRDEYATGTDSEDTQVCEGVEWSGVDGRPPKGGGGPGEGGTKPRGGRPRPATEDRLTASDPTVTALHGKLAEAEARYGAAN